jgi:hypothetical protein
MQKDIKIPIWVLLAFSSIHKRKHALWLIAATVLFALYCIPWGILFTSQPVVSQLFLIEDWSWFAMMVPISIWYLLCLWWMDRNAAW